MATNLSGDTLTRYSKLPRIAGDIGLDVGAFNTCLASGKYLEKIQSDINDGKAGGVRGTPMSFIVRDGKLVDTIQGALPLEVVRQKIEAALR